MEDFVQDFLLDYKYNSLAFIVRSTNSNIILTRVALSVKISLPYQPYRLEVLFAKKEKDQAKKWPAV
jgi:hypothetical protein